MSGLRGVGWAAVLAASLAAAACGDGGSTALGHVDDLPIEVADVVLLLPVEPVVVTTDTTAEARAEAALDLAVRDALLGREAERRGLDGTTRAELLQQLVAQEQANHPELDAAAITESEARAWYRANRHLFDRVARAAVTYAVIADQATAEAAFGRATDGMHEASTVIRRLPDVEESGTVVLDDAREPPEMVERIVNAVRREGEVGLDVDPSTGFSWLVSVDSIEFAESTWDDVLATRVQTALAWEREQAHLDRLADDLAAVADVRINESNLARLVAKLDAGR